MSRQTAEAREPGSVSVEQIAEVAHEANRAYCRTIGDNSQLPWDQAPAWQRKSCVEGVKAILANPEMTPEQSHLNWMAHKRAEGWTWGPVKDPAGKLHPCFRPWDQLPPDQKAKDYIFRAVVWAFISSAAE